MDPKDKKTNISQPPQPHRGNEGGSILGPQNPAREMENPDRLAPPPTDAGTLPNLKWYWSRAAKNKSNLI